MCIHFTVYLSTKIYVPVNLMSECKMHHRRANCELMLEELTSGHAGVRFLYILPYTFPQKYMPVNLMSECKMHCRHANCELMLEELTQDKQVSGFCTVYCRHFHKNTCACESDVWA